MIMTEKELFLDKIKKEITDFEHEFLTKQPVEIYYRAYEIDTMNNIYECLVKMSEELDLQTVKKLLQIPNLLSFFFHQWQKYEDLRAATLSNHMQVEIKNLI